MKEDMGLLYNYRGATSVHRASCYHKSIQQHIGTSRFSVLLPSSDTSSCPLQLRPMGWSQPALIPGGAPWALLPGMKDAVVPLDRAGLWAAEGRDRNTVINSGVR